MKPMRAILPLLKVPLTNIDPTGFTIAIGAMYGAPTSIRIPCDTSKFDIRDGDVVTIYTEVLLKGPTDAQPQ
jgi:hypothetical protein